MANTMSKPALGILIVLAALIILAILPELPLLVQPELPPVKPHKHAVERHGNLAYRIRQCLRSDDTNKMVFKDKNNRFFFLCQLSRDKWGFQIAEKINGKWEEITAYYRGGGSLNETLDYFAKNNITKWTGPVH